MGPLSDKIKLQVDEKNNKKYTKTKLITKNEKK